MNTTRQGTHNNFDFTRPPPGYSVSGLTSKNLKSTQRIDPGGANYATLNRTVKTANVKRESSHVIDSRYSHFPLASGNTQDLNNTRLTGPSHSVNSSFRNNLSNQAPKTSIDPMIYALPPPPPPPPSDPYPTNMTLSPGQYVFNPAIYAAYSMPPPAMAGQYITHQEIYYPQQYHTGFSHRGGYYNHNVRKRKMPQDMETDGLKKTPRKRKKPLSQNIPSRKDWSVEDARRALEVEKEFNKRHRSQHLIIKFPDLELNRDIVTKFHPQIDSVHFQQPSTQRFCFVTLNDSANIEEVIKELNKIKFGDGYLLAEPKKDREEDFNIGPEDIDPLNLYVGNLAQEVTVDDVVKAYPKNKRIDIGFAKKMKYTRYAFVCFRTVNDAIEAFQNTHATEMYNKSLIVRFRRLHGTVGLPGEPKPQNQQKRSEARNSICELVENSSDANHVKANNQSYMRNGPLQLKEEQPENLSYSYGSDDDEDEEELHYSNNIRNLVVNSLGSSATVVNIKSEPLDYDAEKDFNPYEPIEEKPHVPMLEVKVEKDAKPSIKIKTEEDWDENYKYKSASLGGRRRSSSESPNDEDYDLGDHSNDPLYGAFARASKFRM